MRVLIFEGIATSGKSTVIEELAEVLNDEKVGIADESVTHLPIMEQRKGAHVEFFTELVEEWLGKDLDWLIFDRLYLTQAFRAHIDLASYEPVEAILALHDTKTVFLEVDEVALADRIQGAVAHRPREWSEYLAAKGSNVQEIAQTYIEQQRHQLTLLKQSKLPQEIFDTTSHDYQNVVRKLLER